VHVVQGVDKSLARPGRKQATATEILMFIYPIYNHDWRNISTIYTYNKTSIKRNILTIKNKIHREVGRAKELSAPRYTSTIVNYFKNCILPCLDVGVIQELASGAENPSYSFVTRYSVIF
jgi:hypothetical protein